MGLLSTGVFLGLSFVAVISGQVLAPVFSASSVIPTHAKHPEPLKPQILVSIYGRNLGPVSGCTSDRSALGNAKELCGTVVTVGGVKASLLYAQDHQINLRVPANVPTEGMIPFVVAYHERASRLVAVRFAPYKAEIGLTGPAYVHMPIWIDVRLPDPLWHSLRYPITIRPADFDGHEFEVRRNGAVIPPSAMPPGFPIFDEGPAALGTIGAGSVLGLPHESRYPHRLPLHLQYRINTPGLYEVRYVGYGSRYQTRTGVLARSAWLKIRVQPLSAAKRLAWLASMRAGPPSDPTDLLTDFIPSLLAMPDSGVLATLEDALYNPSEVVRQYAFYSTFLFDDELIARWLPDVIQRRGPTNEIALQLSWRRNLLQPGASDLVHSVLPYLKSQSPLLVGGALRALGFLRDQYDWKSQPNLLALINTAVSNDGERLIRIHAPEILQPLATFLGGWKADRSRALLWRLVDGGTVLEQAWICLTWIGDPRDLPRLATYNISNREYYLDRGYGAAAARHIKSTRDRVVPLLCRARWVRR
ncbi:MAG: hypothetical protein M3Z32_12430 [Acidobacteriota bacterium]|nr:hypothetical protein [Acidobacteriota bacterium]